MNTIKADFSFGHEEVNTNPLTQWDYGQILQIVGLDLPSIVEIRFSIKSSASINSIPAVGITTNQITKVEIPDDLLQQSNDLVAKIFIGNRESGKTTKIINIPIIESKKPLIPHAPEDQLVFMEVIEAGKNAVDSAKQVQSDALKISSDRIAIEALVKSVSNVETQLNEMKAINTEIKNNVNIVSNDKAEVLIAKENTKLSASEVLINKNIIEEARTDIQNIHIIVGNDKQSVTAIKREMELLNTNFSQKVLEAENNVNNAKMQSIADIVSSKDNAIFALNVNKNTSISDIEAKKNEVMSQISTNTATILEIKDFLQI